jgi:hypothetical protein
MYFSSEGKLDASPDELRNLICDVPKFLEFAELNNRDLGGFSKKKGYPKSAREARVWE